MSREQRARPAATVPVEAFDDTHPDHAEWVERNGRRFCSDDCALHPSEHHTHPTPVEETP